MAKKNITIENLAVMVQKEFDEMRQTLTGLEKNDQVIIKKPEGVVCRYIKIN